MPHKLNPTKPAARNSLTNQHAIIQNTLPHIADSIGEDLAANTKKAYKSIQDSFLRWCDKQNFDPQTK